MCIQELVSEKREELELMRRELLKLRKARMDVEISKRELQQRTSPIKSMPKTNNQEHGLIV